MTEPDKILENDIRAATGAQQVFVIFGTPDNMEATVAHIDGVRYVCEPGSDDDCFVFRSEGRSDILVQFSPEWLAWVHRSTPATVSVADIEAWMRTQKDRYTEWGIDDDDEGGVLEHFLCSCTRRFAMFMSNNGLMCEEGKVTYDVFQFPIISAVCAAVTEEYEDQTEWNDRDSVWRMFDLHGDDDVDYNGSYIDIALDILEGYHTRKV